MYLFIGDLSTGLQIIAVTSDAVSETRAISPSSPPMSVRHWNGKWLKNNKLLFSNSSYTKKEKIKANGTAWHEIHRHK